MVDYTLHSFVESGNAYKVALMLQLCGADWQPKWVNFFKGENRGEEFLNLNIKGEVPVLIDHTNNGEAINQSGVMLTLLAKRFGKYGGTNEAQAREILGWILWDNHKLTSYVATLRFMEKFMGKKGEPETEFVRARALSAIKKLNNHLTDRKFVVGDSLTIADISMVGYLYWPEHFDISWSDYPSIEAWLERVKNTDGWKSPEDLLPSDPTK